MSQALRQLVFELRRAADASPEGATSIQWRHHVAKLPMITVSLHGAGVSMIAAAARNLMLQRGQLTAQSDEALRGVLVEIANILDLELEAIDARGARRAERRAQPYYMRETA
jgi:hypothetical protein